MFTLSHYLDMVYFKIKGRYIELQHIVLNYVDFFNCDTLRYVEFADTIKKYLEIGQPHSSMVSNEPGVTQALTVSGGKHRGSPGFTGIMRA